MKKILVLLILLLISSNSFACSCKCDGDCSFSRVSKGAEFVALVKVLEYSNFLERQIDQYEGKMPYSMKVEVIEKYTGSEDRKILTIWGDNGALCRPYIAAFKIGKYYLIAPSKITETTETGTKNDYDFFTCSTDYLSVDFNTKIAYGEYSKKENQVTLQDFEKEIKGINFKNTEWFTSNNEKKFYKADTITLLRLLNLKDKVVKLNEALIKSEQNKNLNYTELHFKPNSKLIISDTNIVNWTDTKLTGKWKWKYDSEEFKLNKMN